MASGGTVSAAVRTALLTAFKTRGQNIGQSELAFDLADGLHVPYDLESLNVDQALTGAGLSLVSSVRDLARQARVDPEVDQVGAYGGPEQRAEHCRTHTVLARSRN